MTHSVSYIPTVTVVHNLCQAATKLLCDALDASARFSLTYCSQSRQTAQLGLFRGKYVTKLTCRVNAETRIAPAF